MGDRLAAEDSRTTLTEPLDDYLGWDPTVPRWEPRPIGARIDMDPGRFDGPDLIDGTNWHEATHWLWLKHSPEAGWGVGCSICSEFDDVRFSSEEEAVGAAYVHGFLRDSDVELG